MTKNRFLMIAFSIYHFIKGLRVETIDIGILSEQQLNSRESTHLFSLLSADSKAELSHIRSRCLPPIAVIVLLR